MLRTFCLLALLLAAICTAPLHAADFERDVEKQTFKLINEYRARNGFPPLRWNDEIAAIARAHSHDMTSGDVDFGHGGFQDRVDKLKGLIAGFEGAGENVFYASNSDDIAERAVQGWLHSPHHLKNIRGDYNFSGIGVARGKDGALYFTQVFLKTARPGE